MGIASDGTNIWVANSGSNTVTELRADRGVLATIAVGSSPFGVAFDGANIWVTNNLSNTVSKL
jgi:YVTN family beta-propeller protein